MDHLLHYLLLPFCERMQRHYTPERATAAKSRNIILRSNRSRRSSIAHIIAIAVPEMKDLPVIHAETSSCCGAFSCDTLNQLKPIMAVAVPRQSGKPPIW